MEINYCFFLWNFISPQGGVSTNDSIMGKLWLVSEWNIVKEVGVCVRLMVEFQVPICVPRFDMLNLLDMIYSMSLCNVC